MHSAVGIAIYTIIVVNIGMTQSVDGGRARADEPAGSTARASRDHHAGLWSGLVQRADALTATVVAGRDDLQARAALVDFLRGDVLAHLQIEERVLYQAAREAGEEALVATLELDHRFILDLVEHIERAGTALEAALSARALVMLFILRMEKEDAVVLPTLAEAGVDVSSLLDSMVTAMATEYGSRFTYL